MMMAMIKYLPAITFNVLFSHAKLEVFSLCCTVGKTGSEWGGTCQAGLWPSSLVLQGLLPSPQLLVLKISNRECRMLLRRLEEGLLSSCWTVLVVRYGVSCQEWRFWMDIHKIPTKLLQNGRDLLHVDKLGTCLDRFTMEKQFWAREVIWDARGERYGPLPIFFFFLTRMEY